MKRKQVLAVNQIYHIYNRSIAEFKIFNNRFDYHRMIELLKYFQVKKPPTKFSYFIRLKETQRDGFFNYYGLLTKDQKDLVRIIAFCLMPTHIHLILKQLMPNGISIFMSNILNSYTRYFNIKHHRKGPLWESKFQNRLVETDEQLLHLLRYLYLNPVTANIVENPGDWNYSSYNERMGDDNLSICQMKDLVDMNPDEFKKFVLNRRDYQKELAVIKKQLLD